jgi:hypothetical protein
MKLRSAGFLLALVALQLLCTRKESRALIERPYSHEPQTVGAVYDRPNSIGGIVVKAGTTIQQPLLNARLELSGGSGSVQVARTDATGRFVFSNLAGGEYRLAVTCDGFIRQESPYKIVLRGGQQIANIVFALDPAPTAAGTVLDSYGEPIPNIMIEALRRSYDVRGNPRLSRVATALTDDRGEYRIFWLDPAEYFFYVTSPLPDVIDPQPVRLFTPTYFPGVSTPDEARSLRMDIGREIRVDFRLRRAAWWSVSGQTMNGMTSRSVGATITLTPPAEDPTFSRYHAQSFATGRFPGYFSTANVAPGSYIIMAKSGSGDQEITAFQRIVIRPIPYIPPPTRPPEYSVTLKLSPPLSINGRLFVESREAVDLRGASVALISVDPDLPSPRSVFPRPDGQFFLNGAVPGSYVLDITNLPGDLYIKVGRLGSDDILEKPLTLETPQTRNPLQILLGSDGGHLQVAAVDAHGKPYSGAHFVLVPDVTRRSRREQFRLAISGEDGKALLGGIPPGSYKLFAWEYLEPNAYLNSGYLQAYEAFGVPVTIASGDNPPISTRLIPRE